jgi:hypothetical protein
MTNIETNNILKLLCLIRWCSVHLWKMFILKSALLLFCHEIFLFTFILQEKSIFLYASGWKCESVAPPLPTPSKHSIGSMWFLLCSFFIKSLFLFWYGCSLHNSLICARHVIIRCHYVFDFFGFISEGDCFCSVCIPPPCVGVLAGT